jgi:uncharacterized protein YbjT (DUF2867 family)
MLQASGVNEWTIVRCSWFNQNFSESVFAEPLSAGELVLPAGPAGEPFVDADDIADVAVTALLDDGHAGHVYELTGPRLLRFDQAGRPSPRRSTATSATSPSPSTPGPTT